MSSCTECGAVIWHRQGWLEHGEIGGYEYRVSTCKPDSGVCESSPSGFHYPDNAPTWLARPFDRWASLQAWAREVFEEGTNVPTGMRRALTRLWSCYPSMPGGICDPAYMANVVAAELAACAS
jgi:hypothetical protein